MFEFSNSARSWVIYITLMIVLAAIGFNGVVGIPFDTDDLDYIRDGRDALVDPSRLFDADNRLPGRPLIELLFLVAHSFFGADPAGYHLLLVALHLCASVLLAYTAFRLDVSLQTSFLGGLCFLLNVAHFRVVQWISCVAYPVALIFGLIATLLVLRYLVSRHCQHLLLAAVSMLLAVGSHPAAAFIPLFILYAGRRRSNDLKTIATSSGALLVVSVAFAAALHFAFPTAPQSLDMADADPHLMLNNAFVLLGRLVASGNWVPMLPHAQLGWEWMLGVGVGIGLLVLVAQRVAPMADWAVWTLVAVIPFVNRDVDGLSRHLYFASAGFSFTLAWIFGRIAGRVGSLVNVAPRLVLISLALAAVISSTLALKRAEALGYYYAGRTAAAHGANKEAFRYLRNAVDADASLVPVDGYERLAVAGFLQGRSSRVELEKARIHYPESRAVDVYLGINELLGEDPIRWRSGELQLYNALTNATNRSHLQRHAAVAMHHLGLYFRSRGDFSRAAALHKRALQLRPTYEKALVELNRSLAAQGRIEEAIPDCREMVRLQPRNSEARHDLGKLLAKSGNYEEAIVELEKALALDADRPWSWFVLSQVHRLTGFHDAARRDICKALKLDNSRDLFWTEYLNVGIDYHRRGALRNAFDIYSEVARARPEYVIVHNNLGVLYYSQDRYGEAIACFGRAVALEPKNPEAHLLLAQAYEKGGRTQEAIRSYERTLVLNPDSLEAKQQLQALL